MKKFRIFIIILLLFFVFYGCSLPDSKMESKSKNVDNITKNIEIDNLNINDKLFEINFDSSGGDYLASCFVKNSFDLKLLPIPVKSNFSFVGWYTDKNCLHPVKKLECDQTLYAKWTPCCKVKFYDDLNLIKEIEVEVGKNILDFPKLNKEKYILNGWKKENQIFNQNELVFSDISLYADWKIKTFNINYYVGENLFDVKTYKCNENITNLPVISKEGYKFLGWFNKDSKAIDKIEMNENIDLYAKFEKLIKIIVFDGANNKTLYIEKNTKISKLKYQNIENKVFDNWYVNDLVFDFNKAIVNDLFIEARYINLFNVKLYDNEKVLLKTLTIKENEMIGELPILTKEGYLFEGWKHNDSLFDKSLPVDSDLDLYAHFEKVYDVEFYSENILKKTFKVTQHQDINNLQISRENYQFLGWFYNNKKFDFKTHITEDIKLFAKWTKVYLIKYENCDFKDFTLYENDILETPLNPYKEGSKFKSWTINQNINFGERLSNIESKEIILTANWYELFNIHFDYIDLNFTVFENSLISEPETPVKRGYSFQNWLVNDEVFDFDTKINSDLILKPKWQVINYSINYSLPFENIINNNPKCFNINSRIILNSLNYKGYIFEGWFDSDNEKVEEINGENLKNYNLIAKIRPKKVSVNIVYNENIYSTLEIKYNELFSYDISKNGYEHIGWLINNKNYNKEFIWNIDIDNFDIKPVFVQKKYNFSFYDNDEKLKEIELNYGEEIEFPSVEKKGNYAEWFCNNEKIESDFWSKINDYEVTCKLKWKSEKYKINYNLGNGFYYKVPKNDYIVFGEIGSNYTTKFYPKSTEGKKFIGWSLFNNDTQMLNLKKTITRDFGQNNRVVQLYAVYSY